MTNLGFIMIEWIDIKELSPSVNVEILIKFAIIDEGNKPAMAMVSGWYSDDEGFLFDIGEFTHRYVVTHWSPIK